MSQVKPGPNMESAVAMKVSRRDSREEKLDSEICCSSMEEGGTGFDVCMGQPRFALLFGKKGRGERGWRTRVLNMKWLL